MRRKKQSSFLDKISNVILAFLFVVITTWGIQVTNAASSTGLTFAHVSDVHYASNGTNSLYRLTKESPEILKDVIQNKYVSWDNYINEGKEIINKIDKLKKEIDELI